MKKKLYFLLGYLLAAKKGLVFIFWNPIDPNGHNVRDENWGLDNHKLDKEWARIGNDAKGRGYSHTLVNIVVEYTELNKHGTRTFVKLSAAWSVISFVLGIVLRSALGYVF